MMFMVNKQTRAVLESMTDDCTVRQVTKLGGVEAVLLTT